MTEPQEFQASAWQANWTYHTISKKDLNERASKIESPSSPGQFGLPQNWQKGFERQSQEFKNPACQAN